MPIVLENTAIFGKSKEPIRKELRDSKVFARVPSGTHSLPSTPRDAYVKSDKMCGQRGHWHSPMQPYRPLGDMGSVLNLKVKLIKRVRTSSSGGSRLHRRTLSARLDSQKKDRSGPQEMTMNGLPGSRETELLMAYKNEYSMGTAMNPWESLVNAREKRVARHLKGFGRLWKATLEGNSTLRKVRSGKTVLGSLPHQKSWEEVIDMVVQHCRKGREVTPEYDAQILDNFLNVDLLATSVVRKANFGSEAERHRYVEQQRRASQLLRRLKGETEKGGSNKKAAQSPKLDVAALKEKLKRQKEQKKMDAIRPALRKGSHIGNLALTPRGRTPTPSTALPQSTRRGPTSLRVEPAQASAQDRNQVTVKEAGATKGPKGSMEALELHAIEAHKKTRRIVARLCSTIRARNKDIKTNDFRLQTNITTDEFYWPRAIRMKFKHFSEGAGNAYAREMNWHSGNPLQHDLHLMNLELFDLRLEQVRAIFEEHQWYIEAVEKLKRAVMKGKVPVGVVAFLTGLHRLLLEHINPTEEMFYALLKRCFDSTDHNWTHTTVLMNCLRGKKAFDIDIEDFVHWYRKNNIAVPPSVAHVRRKIRHKRAKQRKRGLNGKGGRRKRYVASDFGDGASAVSGSVHSVGKRSSYSGMTARSSTFGSDDVGSVMSSRSSVRSGMTATSASSDGIDQ